MIALTVLAVILAGFLQQTYGKSWKNRKDFLSWKMYIAVAYLAIFIAADVLLTRRYGNDSQPVTIALSLIVVAGFLAVLIPFLVVFRAKQAARRGMVKRGGFSYDCLSCGGNIHSLVIYNQVVWATDYQNNKIVRMNPYKMSTIDAIRVGRSPLGITVGSNAIWEVNKDDNNVSKIDPVDGNVLATISVGKSPQMVAAGEGSIWVTNYDDGTISRIEAWNNQVSRVISVGKTPMGVAVGHGLVWVCCYCEGTVWRIDPRDNSVKAKPTFVGGKPIFITTDGFSTWATVQGENCVVRLDPHTGEVVTKIQVGKSPAGVITSEGIVWVTSQDSFLWRIDSRTNQPIDKPIRLGLMSSEIPFGVSVSEKMVFVANLGGSIMRLKPLVVAP